MNYIITILLVILGVACRLLPHPANFAPILAIGLFAGTYLDRRYAFWLPLIIMLISDYFLGFYSPWVMLSVYGSFTIAVGIGFMIRKQKNIGNIMAGTLGGSLLFFFITNFAVWAASGLYPKTAEGLWICFLMAVPFFKSSLAGDLVYVTILFGAYELVRYIIANKSKIQSSFFDKLRMTLSIVEWVKCQIKSK